MGINEIMNMKLKKMKMPTIVRPKLKKPTLPTRLPNNKNINNVFKVAKGMKQNKMLNYNKNIGQKRIRQQKGLKPWGDFDGDGLINMLDCNPRNKFKQGAGHEDEPEPGMPIKSTNWQYYDTDFAEEQDYKNKGYKEAEYTMVDEPKNDKNGAKSNTNINNGKTETDTELDKLIKERKREEQRLEDIDLKQKEKRLQLLRREEKSKELDIREKEKSLKKLRDKEKADKKKKFVKDVTRPLTGSMSTISGAASGFGGFNVSQQKLASAAGGQRRPRYVQSMGYTPQTSGANKIRMLLGKQAIQEQAQPMPAQQYQQPVSPQEETEEVVYSPYSKRKVSYVRGKYNKQ